MKKIYYYGMLRKNNYPILNFRRKYKFGSDIIEKISKILKPEFEIDKGIKNEMSNTNDKQSIEIDSSFVLLKETKYNYWGTSGNSKKDGVRN